MGKTVSELVSEDTKIDAMGNVTGTLHYIKDWTAFSPGNPELQNGNYMPLTLNEKYRDKEIIIKRNDTERKRATDTEWVIRVESQSAKYSFSTAEDGEFLVLDFTKATLETDMG